jgi:SAM-dependent methyltransferase
MNVTEANVASHYAHGTLTETIIEALTEIGQSRDDLSIEDLAPVEEYHIRGREATRELLSWTNLTKESRVLDVGCGIGGACRFIAERYGAQVTGIDLSAEYCRTARQLSNYVGLDGLTSFEQGTALAMPFAAGDFDLALSLHVQMNIRDKRRYFGEIARVLTSGGELALYEICSGSGGSVYYPVPWASEESISFLSAPEKLKSLLQETGLQQVRWEDVTARCLDWFEQVLEQVAREGPPPVGLHLLMERKAPEKMKNVARNLREDRITVVQAVFEKK